MLIKFIKNIKVIKYKLNIRVHKYWENLAGMNESY